MTVTVVAVAFDVGVGGAPTSAVGDGGVGAVAVVAAPSGRPSWWGRNSRRRSSLRWPPSIAEGVGLLVAALPQRVAVALEPGKVEDEFAKLRAAKRYLKYLHILPVSEMQPSAGGAAGPFAECSAEDVARHWG